jgi:uncharacterized protein
MSSGLSVKLPLTISDTFGAYGLNTTFEELAKQNLKMLVLTNPGERMMNPTFGVGIQSFTFEPNTSNTYGDVTTAIKQQAEKFLPYISIDNIQFRSPENNPSLFPNTINVVISFTIVPLRKSSTLQIQTNRPI